MSSVSVRASIQEHQGLFENLATDFFRAAYRTETSKAFNQELETLRYRSALRLVPKPTLGLEHVHWQAAEHFQQFEPEEADYLINSKDPFKAD